MSRSVRQLHTDVEIANHGLFMLSLTCATFLFGVCVRSGFPEPWRAAIGLAGLMLYGVSVLVWHLVRLHLERTRT